MAWLGSCQDELRAFAPKNPTSSSASGRRARCDERGEAGAGAVQGALLFASLRIPGCSGAIRVPLSTVSAYSAKGTVSRYDF